MVIVLVLFTLISSFSQTKENWYSYRNEAATWNKYTKEWEWGQMYEAHIPIVFGQRYVKLYNKSNSFYTVLEDYGEKTTYSEKYPTIKITTHEWSAIDEDYKKCRIMLTTTSNSEIFDPIIVAFMYDDVILRFYCKFNKEIDSFFDQKNK